MTCAHLMIKTLHKMYYYKVLCLSILKPGSYTCRGSNICRVVQKLEHLGLLKCRVPKLLNLLIINMVPCTKRMSTFWICLLICTSYFSDTFPYDILCVSSMSKSPYILCWPLTTLSNL